MTDFAPWEQALIRLTSTGLPLTAAPYAALAETLGVSEADVLDRLRRWRADGIIRRMGARVNHRAAGITANGMSVWNVPDDRVDAVGELLSQCPQITHCYRRPRHSGWPYNLFAMVHGDSESAVHALVADLSTM